MNNDLDKEFYKSDYFYSNFKKNHRFIESLPGKRKKDRVLTYTQWKKIIYTYFKVYFFELFYIDKPLYFILSGRAIRVRTTPFLTPKKALIKSSITMLWYLKPLYSLGRCRINFIRGSNGIMPKIRQEWAKNNDVSLLPMIRETKKKMIQNKTLFLENDKRDISI